MLFLLLELELLELELLELELLELELELLEFLEFLLFLFSCMMFLPAIPQPQTIPLSPQRYNFHYLLCNKNTPDILPELKDLPTTPH